MEEVIKKLKEDGIAKGLCQPWQLKLGDGVSMKRLAELYVKGIDFCISNDYPTLDFIRANFKGKCEPYGVYVDERNLELSNVEKLVLLGGCKGALNYSGFSVCRAFVRHWSEARIKVSGFACITIDVYDDSSVSLEARGSSAKVWVNVYGNAKFTHTGKGVKVHYINAKY